MEADQKKKSKEIIYDNDDHLGMIIDKFEPLWLKKMQASHLVLEIDIPEVQAVGPLIHGQENKGDYSGAAKLLLDAIRNSTQQGKWHVFVDALTACDDSAILKDIFLEEGDLSGDKVWLNEYANYNLINLFAKTIADKLNLSPLLNDMIQEKLLHKKDTEQLIGLIDRGKRWDANFCFLFKLHRHNKNWYKIFMSILYKDENQRLLVEEIDPEEYEKLQERANKTHMRTELGGFAGAADFQEGEEQSGSPHTPKHEASALEQSCQCSSPQFKSELSQVKSDLSEVKSDLSDLRREVSALRTTLDSIKNSKNLDGNVG